MRREVALALLGLAGDDLTVERVNEAYRVAMRMNHPDLYASDERLRQHAEEQCKLINEAREALLESIQNPSWSYDGPEEEEAASGVSSAKQPFRPSSAPLLDVWRTSIGYSLLGLVMFYVMWNLEDFAPGAMVLLAGSARIVFLVFQFVYAAVIYPSLFGMKPKIKSSSAVSFWNCAVGCIVFGPLWNNNLTKRTKGVSHIVFIVLMSVWTISALLLTISFVSWWMARG